MSIEFSRECLLQTYQDMKQQLSWAWCNMQESQSPADHDRWQDLVAFLHGEYFRLLNEIKTAPDELVEVEMKEATEKAA